MTARLVRRARIGVLVSHLVVVDNAFGDLATGVGGVNCLELLHVLFCRRQSRLRHSLLLLSDNLDLLLLMVVVSGWVPWR